MEKIDLNLIPGEAPPVCHVSQFDTGRTIRANLFDGSAIYTLTGEETITINVRKPDSHVVTRELTAVSSRSYVTIRTTRQMTACAGNNLCELSIEKGSTLIGTTNFMMEVEEDPLNGGVTTLEAYSDLEQQIIDILDDM